MPTTLRHMPDAAPRVLIVDDSAVARAVLTRMTEEGGQFVVAGAVPDVPRALAFLGSAQVDAILLDLAMPGVDGLTGLPDLLAVGGAARVLIVSSSGEQGGKAALQALALGAADTLAKPGGARFAGTFGVALRERLARLTEPASATRYAPRTPRVAEAPFEVVAIGASTGGIHALSGLLRAIPAGFDRPIVITQHLPLAFSPYFAAQIAVLGSRPCDVARDRMRLVPGRIVVAPGDAHIVAAPLGEDGCVLRLSGEAVANGNMPSVDPMLSSLAEVYGPRLLAVVLSGMGRDGLAGAAAVRRAGGTVIVQDEASSVVWGMPGAVAGAGLADAVMPPDAIGRLIARQVARG
ncbi:MULTISPECIES: chemotaxis protein CheB [Sphingomonas]|uniref:chemotaxis protein CheB n=2 Tax=Sphingomonadaceae TaxID=41297 RepID=UPI00092BEC4B|nr:MULTISPECIES: chemotaxis protein CheB [Sphingomonas]MCW6529532.1 chemotaxis protein CheB [Sphingomonas lycopersici]OJU22967.1 MAG: chemotaxis response regulator protein-glutamate methylesterase [Sphingomonas sp. 66-10]